MQGSASPISLATSAAGTIVESINPRTDIRFGFNERKEWVKRNSSVLSLRRSQ